MNDSLIRNFCIISHIDHGKSTLSDRFLELTQTIPASKMRPQYLDSMDLEREKGITIKMHPVRMTYSFLGKLYTLHLIDTPGHVDFSYEISRALACVEGAVLLVDATKGIQAQTLFNLEMAKNQNLKILGAVNKIDAASQEQTEKTKKELAKILNQKEEDIFLISAKKGIGVRELLQAIIKKVPPPKTPPFEKDTPFGLIFDSKYDPFLGVIAFLRMFEGEFEKGDKFCLLAQHLTSQIKEVGYFSPELKPCTSLKKGEIGYITTGIKDPSKVRVGDTVVKVSAKTDFKRLPKPLSGYQEPKPVFYLTLYPVIQDEFDTLEKSLQKIRLTDPSLKMEIQSEGVLGRGVRVGFLGALQAEIIMRRLKEEFGVETLSTFPQVVYKVITKNGKVFNVSSPSQWPQSSPILSIQEPYCKIEIVTPPEFFNALFRLFDKYEISLIQTTSLTPEKLLLVARCPLRKIISGNFYDNLKSVTHGFASFGFEIQDFQQASLVKLDILIAGKKQEILSRIIPEREVFSEAKKFLKKLKKVLPRQQFPVRLQGVIGGKIIASETIPALRKDVLAPLYGGDVTRKKKLLEIQKRGKKKLAERADIKISPETFLKILKSD